MPTLTADLPFRFTLANHPTLVFHAIHMVARRSQLGWYIAITGQTDDGLRQTTARLDDITILKEENK